MEIELKYLIPDRAVIDSLWHEDVFAKYGDVDPEEQVEMKAVYYDTADEVLSGVDAAFRIRREGDIYVATLKWNGTQTENLHEREELNLPLSDPAAAEHPTMDIFAQSEKGRELMALIGEKPLLPRVTTDFTRSIMRVDTGTTICEVDLDIGEIKTQAGSLDISEIEIELFSGSIDEVTDIGKDLAERFGLEAGVDSKYARGLALLRDSAAKKP